MAARPGAQVRDGGIIAPGYDADLDELRALNDTAAPFWSISKRGARRSSIASLKVDTTRSWLLYRGHPRQRGQRCPMITAAARPSERRALHAPELKAFEDKGPVRPGTRPGREKLLYDAILATSYAHRADPPGHRPGRRPTRPAGGLRQTPPSVRLVPPQNSSTTVGFAVDAGRHPVVEGEIAANAGNSAETFIANDLRLDENRASSHHPAPAWAAEHHAPGGAHFALNPIGSHVPCQPRRPRPPWTASSSPASAPPTTWLRALHLHGQK